MSLILNQTASVGTAPESQAGRYSYVPGFHVNDFSLDSGPLLRTGIVALASTSRPEIIPEPATKHSAAKILLKHAGTWAGSDFDKCLEAVYESRGEVKF